MGVLSIVGWWIITCSGISNNVQSIIGMATFANPDYESKQWHSYLLYVALILITRKLTNNPFPHDYKTLTNRG